MSEILDEFNYDLYCDECVGITEHNIQKVDEETNGKYIGYYGKCNICGKIKEVEESELN